MKRQLLQFGMLVFAASNLTGAAPAPQPEMTLTEGASGTWNVEWSGVTSRTYFLEWSLDLVNWQYAPLVEFGIGLKSFGIDTEGEETFFVRLQFVDDAGITSLQQARNADFDDDGIANFYEVENLSSDPLYNISLGGDSDNDGMPDQWERANFGDLTHNGTADDDEDGLTDVQEWDLGTNPSESDTDGDGAADGIMRQELEYDKLGRLITADGGASGVQSFVTDPVGNVEQANGAVAEAP